MAAPQVSILICRNEYEEEQYVLDGLPQREVWEVTVKIQGYSHHPAREIDLEEFFRSPGSAVDAAFRWAAHRGYECRYIPDLLFLHRDEIERRKNESAQRSADLQISRPNMLLPPDVRFNPHEERC